MRLVQEQEGGRNWVEIAAKLNQANEEGDLNPELHRAGRTRSNEECRKKVEREVERDHKGARSPISCPFSDITNKLRKGTRKHKPTAKVEENC